MLCEQFVCPFYSPPDKKEVMFKPTLVFRIRICLAVVFCLCLTVTPFFLDSGVYSASEVDTKSKKALDAVTAATQNATSDVAVVVAGDTLALEPDSSYPFGLGEIGRMVSETVALTGVPRIYTGSSVRKVIILADISHPVYDSGVNTNPHVAAALVRELYRMDSTLTITLACAPEYWVSPDAEDAPDSLIADGFTAGGYSQMVSSLAAELPGLDLSLEELNLDSTRACETYMDLPGECDKVFYIASQVARADYLIVLAKLKTGPLGVDCALGALRLALPGPVSGWPRFTSVEPRFLDETLISLLGSIMVDYVLVDAINCLEGAGTSEESVKAVGAVVAGEDPVAVDAVAARLAGFDPLDMEYLDLAGEMLLGVVDPERINIKGEVELPADRISLARPKRLFAGNEFSNPDYPYQGQGVRKLMYGFAADLIDNEGEVHLPFPGAEGWVVPERSPDEPLGPGEAAEGVGAFHGFTYLWSPDSSEAQLWVGSQIPIRVYLNGVMVLERKAGESGGAGEIMDLRVPNETVDLELPAGGSIMEVYGEFGADNDPEGLFSLHLADRTEEKKYAGSRVPGVVYFLNPAGDLSRSGVVGTAAAGHFVRAAGWNGTVQATTCGAHGAFVLKELDPGETMLKVYDSADRLVADSTLYLEEWQTLRVDFEDLNGGPVLPGDYSGDGRLAVNDVIALLLGMREHPGDTYYDYNGDGNLDISDAIALLLAMRAG